MGKIRIIENRTPEQIFGVDTGRTIVVMHQNPMTGDTTDEFKRKLQIVMKLFQEKLIKGVWTTHDFARSICLVTVPDQDVALTRLTFAAEGLSVAPL